MKQSLSEFIAKAQAVHGSKYDYSQVNYINNRTKINIICPEHGPFWQIPQNHIKNSHGCKLCGIKAGQHKMHEEYTKFKSEYQKLYPAHDLKEPTTFSPKFRFTFICAEHGDFVSSPLEIMNSWQCPKCNNKSIPAHYLDKLQQTYPHFDYSSSIFTDRDSEIEVTCKTHGKFNVHFRRHLKGQIGCHQCKENGLSPIINKRTIEDKRIDDDTSRIKIFNELFKGSLKYIQYENGYLTFECPKHGEQRSYWTNVQKGKGCRKCASIKFRQQYNLGTDEFVNRSNAIHNNSYDYSLVEYKSLKEKVKIICKTHGVFEQSPDNHINGHGCPICKISNIHNTVLQYLDSINVNYVVNDRILIKPLEIDIYIPHHKLGIEINGLYWHSDNALKKNTRHITKTLACQNVGIKLVQFTDREIIDKWDIVVSMLNHNMNLSSRLHARNMCVVPISPKIARDFLSCNHLKGPGLCSISYALMANDTTYAVMSFVKDGNSYKIDRFAIKLGYHVAGAASKLFKRFILDHSPSKIITYADARYATGTVYEAIGMKYVGLTRPGYCYVRNQKAYSRQKFQKHKLSKLLENYDDSLTEKMNMINNGYRIFYDCGNWKYEWNR